MHTLRQAKEAAERKAFTAALDRTQGNVAATARELGLSTRAAWYALARLGLNPQMYRKPQTGGDPDVG